MRTYNVTRFVVSDANPSETPLNYGNKLSAIGLINALAYTIAQDEQHDKEPSSFPEFETRTTRFVIEVTEYLSCGSD